MIVNPPLTSPHLYKNDKPSLYPSPRIPLGASVTSLSASPSTPNYARSFHPTRQDTMSDVRPEPSSSSFSTAPVAEPRVRTDLTKEKKPLPEVYVGYGELESPTLVASNDAYFHDNGEGGVFYAAQPHRRPRPRPKRRASVSVTTEEESYQSKSMMKPTSLLTNIHEEAMFSPKSPLESTTLKAAANTSPALVALIVNNTTSSSTRFASSKDKFTRPHPPPLTLTLALTTTTTSTAPSSPTGGFDKDYNESLHPRSRTPPGVSYALSDTTNTDDLKDSKRAFRPVQPKRPSECATPADYFVSFLRQ